MSEASIIFSSISNSDPAYIDVIYLSTESIPPSSDSTSLIELNLLAPNPVNYLTLPNTDLTGETSFVDISSINVSCDSTNFDVRIFSKNDINSYNTIYESYSNTNNNLSLSDLFSKFIVLNKDTVTDSKLYMFITNNDAVNSTGNIYIELLYNSLN